MKKWFFIVFVVLVSCQKDKLGPQGNDQTYSGGPVKVLVINEGNFGWGNASLGSYNPDSKVYEGGVFDVANGYALGDVAQSIELIDGKYFIVVNNSGKIEILDTSTLEVSHTITGMLSPRYLVKAAGKLFVTDLYANKIHIFNATDFSSLGNISVDGWTEDISYIGNNLFVSVPDSARVLVIDPATETIVKKIRLRKGVGKVLVDKNGDLWNLCSGGSAQGALYRIDPVTLDPLDSLLFSASDSPGHLTINVAGDRLYYLNTHLFDFPIGANSLPTQPILDGSGKVFYALAVNASDEKYVADAKDYIQKSDVYRLDATNQVADVFSAGIITSGFAFP